jgi:hypothetical protein
VAALAPAFFEISWFETGGDQGVMHPAHAIANAHPIAAKIDLVRVNGMQCDPLGTFGLNRTVI